MRKEIRFDRKTAVLAAFALVLAFVFAGPLAAQANTANPPGAELQGRKVVRAWFASLNLKDTEIQAIEKIVQSDEPTLAKDRAEIRVLQAQIARMMLDKEPAMADLEGAVKKSLGWEQDIRMIQIKRQLAVRGVLGEERWQTVLMIAREARLAERAGIFAKTFSNRGLSSAESARLARFLRSLRVFM